MRVIWISSLLCVALGVVISLSCQSWDETAETPNPGDQGARVGDEIMVAGQLVHTGAKVVLWFDPGGYDAYRPHRHFNPDSDKAGPTQSPDDVVRFGSYRRGLAKELEKRVKTQGWTLADLQETVSQVVIHYDACGTSRQCFKVLHDIRGLSCHFLLDADGTIYQTLDLKERAWHAAQANDRSVGIEIAQMGAKKTKDDLAKWYREDDKGLHVEFPDWLKPTGLPEGFVVRPARQDLFGASVNDRKVVQYDFTEEQYRALEQLLTALCRTFPKVKARAPLDENGAVSQKAFPNNAELFAFEGLIGHHHVSTGKDDPGPAFDWKRILAALEAAGIPAH